MKNKKDPKNLDAQQLSIIDDVLIVKTVDTFERKVSSTDTNLMFYRLIGWIHFYRFKH